MSVIKSILLILTSGIVLSFGLYAILLSKLLPSSGSRDSPVLEAIASDRYYCLLVVVLVPVSVFFAFLNWVGLKQFRHN